MPQRASLRIKGIASDGSSVADELRNGQIVVKDSNQSSIWGPFSRSQETSEPKPRAMPTGVMPIWLMQRPLPLPLKSEILRFKICCGGHEGWGSNEGMLGQC